MRRFLQVWIFAVVLVLGGLAILLLSRFLGEDRTDPAAGMPAHHAHLDHSAFFDTEFKSGPEVTKACLECHEDAARTIMGTSHWRWLGDEVKDPRTGEMIPVGKRNLLNNFCIGIQGNQASCTRCHAGYGWEDSSFDFTDEARVDCLVCHDRSGQYLKGSAGRPRDDVDLLAAAKSVGYPQRTNCGVCHHYGGGGLGVKHGDLDSSLDNPTEVDDVHMGRENMLCIDCHSDGGHNIKGKAFSVSVNDNNGIECTDCHDAKPHEDVRLNEHTDKVACQTCHIPAYARTIPTKTWWDWSKAGDDTRRDDTHHYLKIKGEFKYQKDVKPEYYWFDKTVNRYMVGQKVSADKPIVFNAPGGARGTPGAKIWPFKVHRGKQPYDTVNHYLIAPVTSGKGGYWHDFDWSKALEMGAEIASLKFSGKFDFVRTRMYWPLSHMVTPADRALQCGECHGEGGRLDWKALGYNVDPMRFGGAE